MYSKNVQRFKKATPTDTEESLTEAISKSATPNVLPPSQSKVKKSKKAGPPLQQQQELIENVPIVTPAPPPPPETLSKYRKGNGKKKFFSKTAAPVYEPLDSHSDVPDITEVVAPDTLLAQKRKLKKISKGERFSPVKLYRREFFQNTDDNPPFMPLSELKSVITKESLSGDLTQLHFSGVEQLTDFSFYILSISKGNFSSLNKLVCTGCVHLTDQSMKWAAKAFPALQAVVLDGCEKITEKGLYHILSKYNSLTQLVFTSTNVGFLPEELAATKLGQFSILGCPMMSMSSGIDRIAYSTACCSPVLSDKNGDYKPITTYKVIVALDSSMDYSFVSLLNGESKPKPINTFTYWKEFIQLKDNKKLNFLEISDSNPCIDRLVTPGCIVMLSYSLHKLTDVPKLVISLARKVSAILCKCTDVMFYLIGLDENSETTNSVTGDNIQKSVIDLLEIWRGGMWRDLHAITLKDWRMEQIDFNGQMSYAAGAKLAEEICKLKGCRINSVIMPKKNVKKDSFNELLSTTVKDMGVQFRWIPRQVESKCFTSAAAIPRKIFSNQLALTRETPIEYMKDFNHVDPFPTIGKFIEFLQTQGEAIIIKDDDYKNYCATDLIKLTSLLQSVLETQPPSKADVPYIDSTELVSVWTEDDLKQKFSTDVETQQIDSFIEYLVDMNLVLPIRPEVNKLDVEICGPVSSVYIPYDTIPTKPTVDLLTLWPKLLPDKVFQRDKMYTFLPGLPISLFPTFIKKLSKLFKFTLLWKTGLYIPHGPVDVLIEIVNNKHKLYEDAYVISIQGRIALWSQLDIKEHINFDGKCLWSVLNTITCLLDDVCLQFHVFAMVTIPCLTCVPNKDRCKMLGDFTSYHFNKYLFNAGHDRGMTCKLEQNSKVVDKIELMGEDMPSLVPYHNYSYMVEANEILNKDDSLFPCGVPTDPFGEKQCWSCYNCLRKDNLVCHHCGLCQYCVSLLAESERKIAPGFVSYNHFIVKDNTKKEKVSNKQVRLSKFKGKGAANVSEINDTTEENNITEEQGDILTENNEDNTKDVERIIDAKSLMSGCLISLLKDQELQAQYLMNGTYFNKFSITIITGKFFTVFLEIKNKKIITFDAANGCIVDQNGIEHKDVTYKVHTADVFTIRVEDRPNGRSVIYLYIQKREIYQEDIEGCQIGLRVKTGLKSSFMLQTPGLKPTWQYDNVADFQLGMTLAYKDGSGVCEATIVEKNNALFSLKTDTKEKEKENQNNLFDFIPFSESDTIIVGRTSKDISPIVDQNGVVVVAPIWLFNQLQTDGKLAEYLKGKKENQLIQKCTSIFHPSVIYAEMKRCEPEIEDVVFRQGGVDFTGSAHILLPQNLDIKTLFHCSNLNLTKDLNLQPICYLKGDMNSVMTFRPIQAMSKTIFPYRILHILDVEGYHYDSLEGVDTITNNNYDKTILLWAWHLITLSKQEHIELEVSTVLKKIEGVSSVSKIKVANSKQEDIHLHSVKDSIGVTHSVKYLDSNDTIRHFPYIMKVCKCRDFIGLQASEYSQSEHLTDAVILFTNKLTNAIYRIIHQMCFHLYFGLGPLYEPMSFNKDNLELNSAARDLEEIVEQNLSNSGLKPVTVMFSEDKIYMCEAHKSCWQVNGELTEVPLNLFKSNSYYLKSIHLANNKIEILPEEFFTQLPCLADIDIDRNQLKEIPASINQCKRLLAFTISSNLLTTLPEEMAACKLLERLDITGNKMKVIPPVVTKLTNLYRFYASNMLLKELPDDFGNLIHLDKLNLNGNCFTSLPKSFSQLKNLTELFLNGVPWFKAKVNSIVSKEHFEEHLAQNGLLEWLEGHNQDKLAIFKFFDEDTNGTLDQKELGKLNAVMFNIFPRFGYKGMEPPDDDMPSGFPPELLELTKLSYLGFRYHGIISVPEEIDRLTELTVLHLGNNPNLLSLPAQLANLQLKRLDIEDCPMLKTPPKEIRAKGFATTMAYLKRLLSGSAECMRTKLMLVGLGGAGKTSLVKALLSNENKTKLTVGEDITDGIDICPWKVTTEEGELTFSVWDFAGQTVYYNTHQFFLSDRAVYLLLWNIRLGYEHAGLDFWLSSISVHAPKAPIFIVGTHVDQVSKVELPTKSMLERYPQIAGFHYISSHTGKGIDELKSKLVDVTLTQQYMGEKIPGVWLGLEQSLQEIQEKCVISYDELEKRANISGIFDKSEVIQAVQFLHELGSLQYFQNEFLKGHVVISPQWIVDVMACIVSVKDSAIKDGRLRHADIGKVWKKYPEDLHWWLLRLTEEFDLTFRLTDKPLNIIPCLLPEKEPDIDWPDIEKNSSLKETRMVYKFDYLPAGLFNRGQVRLHQFSDSAYIWKRGSFLKKNEHICLIKQVKESELIVKAQGARPENVLFLVHEVFEGLITESFQGVTYDFFLPCPDCQKLVLKDPHLFAASTIRRATELRAPFLQCLKYFHTISIMDLQAMLPPDSNTDYDLHLVQAVRGLKELQKELTTDLFMSYCAEDIKNPSDSVPCKTIVNDLQNKGYRSWYKEDASKYTVDEMARALIDSSVFVAFISNNYVKDETCCNLFKYARLTLHKPIIIIATGSGLEWKQSKLGILLVDEVFVDMRNKDRYKHKFPELIKTIHDRLNRNIEIPSIAPCFISYSWQNSLEAVSKGSRQIEGALGVTDPRSIKVFLEEKKVKCWLDVERTGNNGLFDDIAEGLINSKIMVACVSDEYSSSPNCQYEFRYAVNTLKLPIVLAVVGTGSKWRASEIGILSLDCPIVSFQEKSDTAYNKLLEIVKGYMPEEKAEEKKVENNAGNQQKDLSFQELLELAQRKFLRQIMHYAEKQDTSPYPRLFVTDFMKHKTQEVEELQEKKDKDKKEDSTNNQKIKKRKSELVDDDDFYRQKYAVNILCENDEGWHCCSDPLPLAQDFGTTSLEKFSPYIARVTAIAKYNKHLLLNCLESNEGQKFLKWLEESPQVAVSADFEQIYYELRQEVMQADITKTMGSLSRCHLPNGKIIWLCEEHQKSMRVTVLSNEDVINISKATESLTIDYMLQALREVDISDVSSQFKGHKQRIGSAKRQIENVKEQKPPAAATSITSQSIEKKTPSKEQTPGKSGETKPTSDTIKPNASRPSSKDSVKRSAANPVSQNKQNETNNSNQSNARPLTRQTSRACIVM